MSIEELQHKMEQKLDEFEKKFDRKIDSIANSVDKLTEVFIGDKFNTGYTQRIQHLEDRINIFEKFADKLKYERVIATTVGTIIGALLTIASQFLKH